MDTKDITITITGAAGAGKTKLACLIASFLASCKYAGAHFEVVAEDEKVSLAPAMQFSTQDTLDFMKGVDHSDRHVTIVVGETLADILMAVAADGDDAEGNSDAQESSDE